MQFNVLENEQKPYTTKYESLKPQSIKMTLIQHPAILWLSNIIISPRMSGEKRDNKKQKQNSPLKSAVATVQGVEGKPDKALPDCI